MSNELTDRSFWTSYWESKPDLAVPVPPDYLFYKQLRRITRQQDCKTAIELGGFPGYYSIFLKNYARLDVTLLDYFIHRPILKKVLGVNGLAPEDIEIIEADLFSYQPQQQYDLVLSCGLIEHFEDTKDIIERHIPFLNPGGTLFITLPNFKGINGWVQKTFDRDNYLKHNISSMDPEMLGNIAATLGLTVKYCGYFGGYSLWLENKQKKSAPLRAFIKTLWFIGKVPLKIFPFESKILSPYIILEATL